jgi:hypothetical protein
MRGWILDLYPGGPGEMVVWLKLEDGRATRLVDSWSPSIYIGAERARSLLFLFLFLTSVLLTFGIGLWSSSLTKFWVSSGVSSPILSYT